MEDLMAAKKSKQTDFQFRWMLTKFFMQLAVIAAIANFAYQLYRKPTEMVSFFSFLHHKTPTQTWSAYRNYFNDASTDKLPAEFLAALAQNESSGNPWASPPWRFRFTTNVAEIYRPASTAVGLYQFLDETFRNVAGPCLGDNTFSLEQCHRYGSVSSRLSAQSSTQFAAGYLDRELRAVIAATRLKTTPQRELALAAVIHLCGKGKGMQFARTGLSWDKLGPCGSHSPQLYAQRILAMQATFQRLRMLDTRREIASTR